MAGHLACNTTAFLRKAPILTGSYSGYLRRSICMKTREILKPSQKGIVKPLHMRGWNIKILHYINLPDHRNLSSWLLNAIQRILWRFPTHQYPSEVLFDGYIRARCRGYGTHGGPQRKGEVHGRDCLLGRSASRGSGVQNGEGLVRGDENSKTDSSWRL